MTLRPTTAAASSPRQGPRGVRGRRRSAAARRQRPRQRLRRRDERAHTPQGSGAHPAHRMVAPAFTGVVRHHMLSADADEIVAARAGARASPARARRSGHALPAYAGLSQWNASSAAISPARPGRSTARTARWRANDCPTGLEESARFEHADLQPGDEGRGRATTRTSPSRACATMIGPTRRTSCGG